MHESTSDSCFRLGVRMGTCVSGLDMKVIVGSAVWDPGLDDTFWFCIIGFVCSLPNDICCDCVLMKEGSVYVVLDERLVSNLFKSSLGIGILALSGDNEVTSGVRSLDTTGFINCWWMWTGMCVAFEGEIGLLVLELGMSPGGLTITCSGANCGWREKTKYKMEGKEVE